MNSDKMVFHGIEWVGCCVLETEWFWLQIHLTTNMWKRNHVLQRNVC